ncbi:hypothetical protein LCGC14_0018220 [marine sediment metagenome]|uniref:Uncharacterized protein n=1 Tax=marine sediment metagenome TaxID=412755 RepID=A0A0F9W232_9ZZZZ|nr:glycosyltransferase family 2 protein [Phycisphaerae bacterium]HDZ44965.1 glycosyltransferase family 2 protein [Phycisphaerae bacterium]
MVRFVVNQPQEHALVSIVLLDWSCRESFHLLDYLAAQTVDRSQYEIIWTEFYDTPAEGLCRRIDTAQAQSTRPPVDVYALMDFPPELCCHRHALFNLGIVLARGRIVCFCDSDAIVQPTFVESIIEHFRHQEDTVLHMDEVRNNDPSFYPFNYPSLDEVTGFGCINWIDGRPVGILDEADPLHSRNYGACMAAARDDLIAIGGADMHTDYLGYICGFYEMSWRLTNFGRREVWSDREWLYHVWHPGQTGNEDIAGPHDGLSVSTRALQALRSDRVQPFVESPAIVSLRTQTASPDDAALLEQLVEPAWLNQWRHDKAAPAGDMATTKRRSVTPPFGLRLSFWAKLQLMPLVAGMARRQLRVKRQAAAWSRPTGPKGRLHNGIRKVIALKSFLKRIYTFDKHWIRQCWLALALAEQRGCRELVLYGEGDAAKALCHLARHLPVEIVGICPFRTHRPEKLLGRRSLTHEQLAETDALIILAAFVDTAARLEQLRQLGIDRERVIVLR